MTPEQESKAEADRQLDESAYQCADICREIKARRGEVANFADRLTGEQREASVLGIFEQIDELERKLNQFFPHVESEIKNLVRQVDEAKREEISQIILIRVLRKLHTFHQRPVTETRQGSKFRGWLRKVTRSTIIDYFRATNRERQLDAEQNVYNNANSKPSNSNPTASSTSNPPESSKRELPEIFAPEEEQQIEVLPTLCRDLFLFSTGLWHQLSPEKKRQWPDAKPSDFELARFNAIGRANRFVLRSVEDDLAQRPHDWDADYTVLVEELRRKKANVVAQNLNRHFWKFMQLDTVWQYLFENVELLDEDLFEQIEESLEPDLMLAYLQCDVFMRCDTSTRCFAWLDECGFENSITHNLGRVAGQNSFIDDSDSGTKLRINEKKWEYACGLANRDSGEITGEEFIMSIFTENEGPFGRALPLSVAVMRKNVDLPLAFKRMAEASLLDENGEANDE